jgi:putative membrane protein
VGVFAIAAFLITFLSAGGEAVSYSTPWIIFCGAAAISAMLLPGISGSYLLVILGMYGIVLENTVTFVTALKSGSFDVTSFIFLAKFAFGIMIGAALFSKIIGHFFERYHDIAMASLAGFVLGSLRAVWPYQENVDFPFGGALLIAIAGFSRVFLIEFLAKKKLLLAKSN